MMSRNEGGSSVELASLLKLREELPVCFVAGPSFCCLRGFLNNAPPRDVFFVPRRWKPFMSVNIVDAGMNRAPVPSAMISMTTPSKS